MNVSAKDVILKFCARQFILSFNRELSKLITDVTRFLISTRVVGRFRHLRWLKTKTT